nr:MAG TPA: hypothetical protein [Caudoviricetes sp.]
MCKLVLLPWPIQSTEIKYHPCYYRLSLTATLLVLTYFISPSIGLIKRLLR